MFAVVPAWLWVAFTVTAAAAQTARNAMQRDLVSKIGAAGATYVRFVFGLPFALLFLLAQRYATGTPAPDISLAMLAWCFVASMAQIAATALMLQAMRQRSFVVSIAYTKTEPVLVALFSIVFLGEAPTLATALAIAVATLGVILMSIPEGVAASSGNPWKPALIGVASGAFFGLSATCYRGAILSLSSPSFAMTATTTLVTGLAMQSFVIVFWLAFNDRNLLRQIAVNWRQSMLAGFIGAFASQFWYLGFAISTPAKVRTLALIEVPFAQLVSRKLFQQGMKAREVAGIVLIASGVAILLNF